MQQSTFQPWVFQDVLKITFSGLRNFSCNYLKNPSRILPRPADLKIGFLVDTFEHLFSLLVESTSLFADRNYKGKVLLVKYKTEILTLLPILRSLPWLTRRSMHPLGLCFVSDICVNFKFSFLVILALPEIIFFSQDFSFCHHVVHLKNFHLWFTSAVQLLWFFPFSYGVFFTFLMLSSFHNLELVSYYLTLVIWNCGNSAPSSYVGRT